MGLAEEFERRLEKAVEGFFSKTFRSRVEPAEIGRRLLREMEASRSVSVGAVYVPNRYVVRLAPLDHQRLAGLAPTLNKEFARLLRARAKERRWQFSGALSVAFEEDPANPDGRFAVQVFHEATEGEQGKEEPPASLWLIEEGGRRPFLLETDRATIGRLSSCEIVVPDPNASRRHAEVVRRQDGWWITDLGSTNGTLVNGRLIKERRLESGDLIRIGHSELEYREDSEEQ
ncbi:MAG: FhaA domain-containing protein [Actinomycetota bacterium]